MCMFKLSDLIILISKVIKLYFTLMSSITYVISLPIVCLSQYSILVYVPGFHITLVLYFKLVFSWILMRLITGAYFHNVSLAFGNLFFFIFQKSLYLLFIFFKYTVVFFFFFLWWILSYIEMKQPWVFMCSPSLSPLPPPSRFSQCSRSERLSHASNLGWWSVSP